MLMQLKIGLVLLLLGINNAFKSTLKKIIILSQGNTNPLSKVILSQGTQTHYQASILKSWEHKPITRKITNGSLTHTEIC